MYTNYESEIKMTQKRCSAAYECLQILWSLISTVLGII